MTPLTITVSIESDKHQTLTSKYTVSLDVVKEAPELVEEIPQSTLRQLLAKYLADNK